MERRLPEEERDGFVPCRVCFATQTLDPARIELVYGHAYFRCPDCGGSTLIRWEDAVALGVEGASA